MVASYCIFRDPRTLGQMNSLIKALNTTAHMATQNATSDWTIVASPTQPFRFPAWTSFAIARQGGGKIMARRPRPDRRGQCKSRRREFLIRGYEELKTMPRGRPTEVT